MKHGFHFFGPVLALLYVGMNAYAAAWLLRYFRPGRAAAWALICVFTVLAAAFPTARSVEAVYGGAAGHAWMRLGFTWLGASFILFYVLLFFDIIFRALRAFGRSVPAKPYGAAALACAGLLIGLAIINGASQPHVKRIDAALPGLPEGLDGFRIVQISDLHLGRLTGNEKLKLLAEQINSLEPDLIVFTGDIFERREIVPEQTCAVIRTLKARYGLAAALGNHDLFAGQSRAADLLSGCGVRVLRGTVYEPVKGLLVGGVDDLRRARLQPPAAERFSAELLKSGKPVILLSHQPDGWEPLMKGAPGLVLSGHTHNGQIFPFNLIELPFFKYFYGLYKDRDTLLYVTSGAGTWGPPLRLFTDSELPLITLRRQR
ncbi:MAG TPA: hypothetical protein DCZ92_14750 [Elusimicrobia bacterium]|nr:MAG: hypothetical protein A2016_11945 [Elusimicrobia bacterium GWF2_62_30]HBA62041.1 hypothetical protein [Elusimicrobiota bacterium]